MGKVQANKGAKLKGEKVTVVVVNGDKAEVIMSDDVTHKVVPVSDLK